MIEILNVRLSVVILTLCWASGKALLPATIDWGVYLVWGVAALWFICIWLFNEKIFLKEDHLAAVGVFMVIFAFMLGVMGGLYYQQEHVFVLQMKSQVAPWYFGVVTRLVEFSFRTVMGAMFLQMLHQVVAEMEEEVDRWVSGWAPMNSPETMFEMTWLMMKSMFLCAATAATMEQYLLMSLFLGLCTAAFLFGFMLMDMTPAQVSVILRAFVKGLRMMVFTLSMGVGMWSLASVMAMFAKGFHKQVWLAVWATGLCLVKAWWVLLVAGLLLSSIVPFKAAWFLLSGFGRVHKPEWVYVWVHLASYTGWALVISVLLGYLAELLWIRYFYII